MSCGARLTVRTDTYHGRRAPSAPCGG